MGYNSTTPNLGLPQWILSNPPQMSDFNTAFSKIDEFAGPDGTSGGVARLGDNGAIPPSQGGTGQVTLAAAIAALVSSVNPTTISNFSSGVSPASTGGGLGTNTVQIRAIGNLVVMEGSVEIDNVTGKFQQLCTIPSNFAPQGTIVFYAPCASTRVARVQINESGIIALNWIFDLTSGKKYTGNMSWLQLCAMWMIES